MRTVVTETTAGGTTTVNWTYDNLNRLTKLEHSDSTRIIASYEYTLADDGMRTAAIEQVWDGASYDTTNIAWTYDALNRLEVEDYNSPDAPNDFEHTYVYNLVGNRLEKQVTDGNTTYYTYDTDNDELDSEITDGNSITYSYDENGALTYIDKDDDPNIAYTYNLQNRMDSAYDETTTLTYRYNPDGIRVDANDGTTLTKYLIDPFNHTGYAQVLKSEVGAAKTFYAIGHDVIGQATGTAQDALKFFLYDGHGSVRHLADNTGAITESYNYDAYGNAHGFTPSSASTNLLYSGEWHDSTAQQYYLRARWYSPANGRFNRMDPFAGNSQDPQSLHKYLYAHCSPIMKIDPSGREYTLVGTLGTLSIGQIVFAAVALTYVASPGLRDAVEDVIEQEIKILIAMAAAMAMSLEQLYNATKTIVKSLSRSRRKEVYLHYSYKKYAISLVATGLWNAIQNPPYGSFGTKQIYLEGWWAKAFLALPGEPRTAVYIVWPKAGFEPTSEGEVIPRFGMPGGGYEYRFGGGSGGFGTVFGPIPIPKGSSDGLGL